MDKQSVKNGKNNDSAPKGNEKSQGSNKNIEPGQVLARTTSNTSTEKLSESDENSISSGSNSKKMSEIRKLHNRNDATKENDTERNKGKSDIKADEISDNQQQSSPQTAGQEEEEKVSSDPIKGKASEKAPKELAKTDKIISKRKDENDFPGKKDEFLGFKPGLKRKGSYDGSYSSADKKLKNVCFYLGEARCAPDGKLIDELLTEWDKKYVILEQKHGYVQWLFPNHYQSRVNDDSDYLKKEEVIHFKTNPKIYNRLIKAYDMMMDFFGIQINKNNDFKFERAHHFKTRCEETFLTRYHNHMRIERILAHWSVVGFRKYAENFMDFIIDEIEHKEVLRKLKSNHSYSLWKIYKKSNNSENKELVNRCFTTIESINIPSDYFKSLERSESKDKEIGKDI